MRILTPEEKAEEIAMIDRQDQWPLWPLLPVKRRKGDGQFPDCAVMTAWTGADVILSSVDHVMKDPKVVESSPREKFKNAAAAVEAGWVVD